MGQKKRTQIPCYNFTMTFDRIESAPRSLGLDPLLRRGATPFSQECTEDPCLPHHLSFQF